MAVLREAEVVFLPLGGSGEIGMNFNAYGYGPADDRSWIVVDCGVMFGREASTPGIDLIMPDIRYLAEQAQNVRAIVLTHAHEDHIGAIAHLWPQLRCPLYATPFTARLIEDKLMEAGLDQTVQVTVVPLSGHLSLGPFEVDFISITHSIPEPNALSIKTPLGTIVHTGDWKLDPDPLIGDLTDETALKRLGDEGVLALVCDSTNALVPGQSGSEAKVRESLSALIATLKGRVAVTAFASNVARLESVANAARENNRELVLVGRSMHRIVNAARATGYLEGFPRVLSEEDAENLAPSRVLYLCTGSQGEMRSALARIAAGEHRSVNLGPGDAVVFSSRIIPATNCRSLRCRTSWPHSASKSSPSRTISSTSPATRAARNCPRCIAGSARRSPCLSMANAASRRTCPARQIPSGAASHRAGERPALSPRPGRAPPDRRNAVGPNASRWHRAGRRRGGLRQSPPAMSYAGLIVVTLVLDQKGRIATDPMILFEGIPEPIHARVRKALEGAVKRHNPKRDDEETLKEAVRRTVRRAASEGWGKKPVTRVEAVWV